MKEDTIRKLYEGTIRKMVKDNIPVENANHVLVKSLVSEMATISVLVNEANEKQNNFEFDEWYDVIAMKVQHLLKDKKDIDITQSNTIKKDDGTHYTSDYYKMMECYRLGTHIINYPTGKTAKQLAKHHEVKMIPYDEIHLGQDIA